MRVKFSWVLALLLVGCQSPQPVDTTTSDDQAVKPPTQSATVKKKRKPQTTATLPAGETESVEEERVALTPQEQDDVWQRIAMQFKLGIPKDPSVDAQREWFLKNPGHLQAIASRAEPFLYLITEKVEQRGLPLELVLLPIVESSFDPFAYSHGSAAGLWQFISSTGKRYGLKQNFWYDGRRDVAAATDAALDYLTVLNQHFDGDWYHAIAAYNSGEGRVARAIKANKKAGKPIDFFSLDLPKETSGYVPKLIALADVIANQEKYGISIPAIENRPVLATVDPKEQLDLAIAARYAGLTVKELQSFNPAYNQWATAPNGPHQLLIPVEKVERFNLAMEENRGKGIKVVRYKVKSGDTLSTIADKYNTTAKVIKEANQIASNQIRVGSYLFVPTSVKDEKAYALSVSNRLAKTQSVPRGQYQLTHTVNSGESLWTIAKQYNVPYQSLAKWNGMAPKDALRKGQKLVIWKDSKPTSGVIRTVTYKVRSGDTLSGIANKFKVKTADIVKWNDLNSTQYLKAGQQLKLYVDVTKFSA
ncbi:membrane-bound lytic murein transglycosylase D [Vibrio cholerae]|nr:membrane-bound lytic murein transglycosylase D [Vibrio cholerae]